MGKMHKAVAVGAATLLIAAFQNCSKVGFNELASVVPAFCVDVKKPEVAPTVLWDWKTELAGAAAPRYETFDQVMASPMVADLDGDGKVEVVFTTFSMVTGDLFADASTTPYYSNGVLRIVDGLTGKTKLSIGDASLAPMASQSPLLMDIDSDGKIEIFYVGYKNNSVIALNHDFTLRWVFSLPNAVSFNATGLTSAKLDGLGAAEIVAGPFVITENASRVPALHATLASAANVHYSVLALPLDPGNPSKWSIVTHQGIFDSTGARIGSAFPAASRWLAAADIAPEVPGVEVIAAGAAGLQILNGLTGAVISSIDLNQYNDLKCAGGVGGGPPSVGDFDGDKATLEIAVATGRHLTIFDRYGVPKYKTVTQDCSSLQTGLTSFDLNGDGKPEILYADEEYLRIFEIRNGTLEVIHSIVNPSWTLFEFPVMADLSGTGRGSNLILAATNSRVPYNYTDAAEIGDRPVAQAITGVRAFRSTGDASWAPTKAIWNQHAFHPDLVNSRGQLYSAPTVDWSLFRRNTQGFISKLANQCPE
jgi:hypothetical protein